MLKKQRAKTVKLEIPEAALRMIDWKKGEQVVYERLSPTTMQLQNVNDPSKQVVIVAVQGIPVS